MRSALAVLLLLTFTGAAHALPLPDAPAVAWIWYGSDPDAAPTAHAALSDVGIEVHLLPRLGMVTFVAPEHVAAAFHAHFGGHLERNSQMQLHLDESVRAIQGDVVRERVGMARDGPTVLVVDTGVDSAHPDFQDVLVANVVPQVRGGLVVGSLDQVPVVDTAGHGTHVASIVAGSGKGLGTASTGKYQGLYSLGRLASYQVTLAEGESEPSVDTLAALEAFEWALQNQDKYDIRVVTNSWGTPGDFDAKNAVNQASLRLYRAGMLVTFSAGNEGRDGPDTLNKYCQAPWVLCVAAADLDGARASFSSYGVEERPYSHPDLSAPGFRITAASPIGTSRTLTNLNGEALYTQRSGTSMAAPHVAGTAALLLAANPSMSPDQVMDVLVATTEPMADDPVKVGSGFLNARAAFNLAVQTVGNRPAFLRGDEVKYAGAASGDNAYANDALTVGYDANTRPAPLLPEGDEAIWVLQPLGLILVVAAFGAVAIGIQWRKPRPKLRRAPVQPVVATRRSS